MLRYRVINSRTGDDITDDFDWVVSPDGSLNYLEYSDLIGNPDAKLVLISADFVSEIP